MNSIANSIRYFVFIQLFFLISPEKIPKDISFVRGAGIYSGEMYWVDVKHNTKHFVERCYPCFGMDLCASYQAANESYLQSLSYGQDFFCGMLAPFVTTAKDFLAPTFSPTTSLSLLPLVYRGISVYIKSIYILSLKQRAFFD